VPQHSSPAYADPLDLLRRFVPSPLKALYRIGSHPVTVETNDIALFPALPLESDTAPGQAELEWKLIRDLDAPGFLAPAIFLHCGILTVVDMGTACLLALDYGRRQLLGFIGADIDGRTYQEVLVPLFCQMTNERVPQHHATDLFRFIIPGLAHD
jgi:hypothetical protein